ncbi:hypothetical protein BDV32DRAFT_27568 [Aspergillus pseudonomiae]|uniref:Uncharacterized protein n=1 Tax=Aspergillus pseudonomiae TaxID=1506151 RepID=A0A5N7D7G9_9EURO|nr:uncharacterized protein BDV37DRAFT_174866 [Aspergillus pseudonomiae]KAB8253754.1 hypothetical protein BDV32DRAFT_27568 [Aspergillus pseudonomiae]KAE8401688.1 hypothetical protein BDV37DRAFT_174866 [Aspergillus pseudonomiae]
MTRSNEGISRTVRSLIFPLFRLPIGVGSAAPLVIVQLLVHVVQSRSTYQSCQDYSQIGGDP